MTIHSNDTPRALIHTWSVMDNETAPLLCDYCRYSAYKDACCAVGKCALCEFDKRYLWICIKTENITDTTKDSGLSSDSLIVLVTPGIPLGSRYTIHLGT